MTGEERAVAPNPCNVCPFRRTSWPGYLGSDTPTGFIDKTEAGVAMPCHATVDYEREDWKEQSAAAPLCTGSLVYLRNTCKLPYVPPPEVPCPPFLRDDIPQVVEALDRVEADRDTVFSSRAEWLEHHGRFR